MVYVALWSNILYSANRVIRYINCVIVCVVILSLKRMKFIKLLNQWIIIDDFVQKKCEFIDGVYLSQHAVIPSTCTAIQFDAFIFAIHYYSFLFQWCHDDVIKWKHFLRYWPFVRGIHRSPVNSPHKGQWRGALMFPLIYIPGACTTRKFTYLVRGPLKQCQIELHPDLTPWYSLVPWWWRPL